MQKHNILVKPLISIVSLMFTANSFAGGGGLGNIVFDPSNYAENAVTALQTAQSVINETQMVENQLMQIKNEATNLKNLPEQTWNDATNDLQTLANEVQQGQALAYSMDNLDQKYQQMFPSYAKYDATNYSKQYEQWSQSTHDQINDSLQALHTSSDDFKSAEQVSEILKNQSESTAGRMQAIQVGTEVAAEQLNQMIKLRQGIMQQTNSENQFQAFELQKETAAEKSVSQVLQNNIEAFPHYQNDPDFGVIPNFN